MLILSGQWLYLPFEYCVGIIENLESLRSQRVHKKGNSNDEVL